MDIYMYNVCEVKKISFLDSITPDKTQRSVRRNSYKKLNNSIHVSNQKLVSRS